MSRLTRLLPRDQPDEWARKNRVYPPSAGVPGPRDPRLTPYMIPFVRAVASARYKRVAMACGAQMGKTDSELDIIGQRLDQRPAPILYVGPTKDFVSKQFEPRLVAMLDEAKGLAEKMANPKRQTQTRKVVAGVPLRLAHAGSSAALKSDQAAIALVDEYDEMLSNIKGQGDPLGLIEARGDTYADFTTAITSTPSRGTIETVVDPKSGLEFWKVEKPEEVESAIWRIFQEGTRFHWAWKCPHCDDWFIPRWRLLNIPKGATPAEARRKAFLACPRCGGVIENSHKEAMNAAGLYVAPGQSIVADQVVGEPPDTPTCSFWVSGLASPFKTFGDRAGAYVLALNSGESDKVQTAINAGFGEVYAANEGELPDVSEVHRLRQSYSMGIIPDGGIRLAMAVDVQRDRLIYGARAFGAGETSWLVAFDEIHGDTAQRDVWKELAEVVATPIDGTRAEIVFVDSGFRPGDPKMVDINRVYEFCRDKAPRVYATKGALILTSPLLKSQIEVTTRGSKSKFGLALIRLSTDHWKRAVYDRIRRDIDEPGAFFLPADASDEYCAQVVSEARKIGPGGKPQWIRRNRENHALDIEAMILAAAFMKGFHRLRPTARRVSQAPVGAASDVAAPVVAAKATGVSALARLNMGASK